MRDRQLNVSLAEERICSRRCLPIFLVGGHKAGKSTIFKQCCALNGEPYTVQERETHKALIQQHCIDQMRMALSAHGDLTFLFFAFIHDVETDGRDKGRSFQIPDDVQRQIFSYYDGDGFDLFLSALGTEAAEIIQNKHRSAKELNDDIVAALKTLWNEPAIKAMYERRNVTDIDESTAYFWNMLDTLNDPHYLPDDDESLLVHENHGREGILYTESYHLT